MAFLCCHLPVNDRSFIYALLNKPCSRSLVIFDALEWLALVTTAYRQHVNLRLNWRHCYRSLTDRKIDIFIGLPLLNNAVISDLYAFSYNSASINTIASNSAHHASELNNRSGIVYYPYMKPNIIKQWMQRRNWPEPCFNHLFFMWSMLLHTLLLLLHLTFGWWLAFLYLLKTDRN